MKTFSSVMQSIVGCITSTKTTDGTLFIESWDNERHTLGNQQNLFPNEEGQDGLLENQLKSYEVCLSDEVIYILAASVEEAAWLALELSNDRHSELLDVRLIDERKVFP